MKRFFSAVAFCLFLLLTGLFIFLPYAQAETDPVVLLLRLPAPPPPNPLVKSAAYYGANSTGDKLHPPNDDAPTNEMLAYWSDQSATRSNLGYTPTPSEKTVERILAEIDKDPQTIGSYLNILPDTPEIVEKVKRIYDTGFPEKPGQNSDDSAGDEGDYSPRDAIKVWLTAHSKYFSDELYQTASQVKDSQEYVTNQDDLLALTHVDWDRARPLVERLYNDSSQPVSQTLARWALYKHALESNDSGDIDRYRDELKKTVENKSATAGMRDLAMDALVKQGDWSGRDEWYYSLLEDETLYDLKVNGQTYTGLTTIILNSPPNKYQDKMLELVGSDNQMARAAAVRNLLEMIDAKNPEVIRALLPWLENPNWVKSENDGRQRLIDALGTLQMPESVPGLISVLEEKAKNSSNYASNSGMYAVTNSNRMMANVAVDQADVDSSPLRNSAITALAAQKDVRAIAPLRRLLPQMQDYERSNAVRALLLCGGFSTVEQVDALEAVAKNPANVTYTDASQPLQENLEDDNEDESSDKIDTRAELPFPRGEAPISGPLVPNVKLSAMATNVAVYSGFSGVGNFSPASQSAADELQTLLGQALISNTEPDEPLVTGTIDRIGLLEKKDPPTANAMREILLRWQGAAVNAYLLREVKNGKADVNAMIKLLGLRKTLREKQLNEVYDIRSGTPTALGFSACLIEDNNEYDAILNGGSAPVKTAMLACARLIRASLPVQKVAANLNDSDKLLQAAAEKYLISEDSAEARSIVWARHPNEAKILGATYYFADADSVEGDNELMNNLFASIGEDANAAPAYYGYNSSGDVRGGEKRLQKELKEDQNLLGVYAYNKNFVRVYNDKAVFSWEEDNARYRERTLEANEFENLKSYLTAQNANDVPPYVEPCEDCEDKELLMIGRGGGRRVYLKSSGEPEFFSGLGKLFAELRETPAHLHYRLEKDLPNLEILYADDHLKAQAVWKNGGDLRVLIDDENRRKQIDKDLKNQERIEEETPGFDSEKAEPLRAKRREQTEYENYSWQRFSQNQLAGAVSQPSFVEFIPQPDNFPVAAQPGQWKMRGGNREIRFKEDAIYKIERGQIVKIREGYYGSPLITPDGRWLVAVKYGDSANLIRINLLTDKEFPVKRSDDDLSYEPVVFVPSLNKFLVRSGYGGENEEVGEGSVENTGNYFLLDAATGLIAPVKGEIQPLAQQTFRPLQPAANADEFWAAIPDTNKNQTVVGIYNAKTLTMKPLLKIPKISFDSMNMWVDEPENKVYIVYEGHLLRLPLKTAP